MGGSEKATQTASRSATKPGSLRDVFRLLLHSGDQTLIAPPTSSNDNTKWIMLAIPSGRQIDFTAGMILIPHGRLYPRDMW